MPEAIDISVPDSPRSNFSGSPPVLNPATLALLDHFLTDKFDEEQRFQQLIVEQEASGIAGLQKSNGIPRSGEKPMMNVDEYRSVFAEDWQLSQFW